MTEHFDVLVVGAGISGIGAAYYLGERCPTRSFVILEGRDQLGGTWDLFRYPGIRSDSDMYTLGYAFKPWKEEKAIADGDSILRYLHEVVDENGMERHIRFGQYVKAASWSSDDGQWTVEVQRKTGDSSHETVHYTCNFLFMCSGYYHYDEGYTPEFPGFDRFEGRIVHPQKWTEDINYKDKRVIVIGSGATAVTLVPELAKKAKHVTMLQRSPSYVVSVPAEDAIANDLREKLPAKAAYGITRWKNVLLGMVFFTLSRKMPERIKKLILDGVRKELGPDYDIDKHFTPRYKPWDQRVCLVPDGDLFHAIKDGRAEVVTDHIETFTETGITLRSGQELEADLIVTATGLRMRFLADLEVTVDGERVDPSKTMAYKAMMFSGIPNLAQTFGYTNASWTLKSDLTDEYVCRILNHMEENGYRRCVPRVRDPNITELPFLDFSSGYVQRGLPGFPKQGSKAPWKLYQNYPLDVLTLRYANVADDSMEFS